MLILIAGITGNIGHHAARYGLEMGHQIRGLARSPDKLDTVLRDKLESFVVSKTYYDVPAIEKAVSGVDAVICAYGGLPELHLDGQLLLFRATERAGVKRYLAASWNYDWRRIPFESEPIYDPIKTFHAQVTMTSNLKPLYILSGMLVDVFFGPYFTPKDGGVWDPSSKSMDIWGTGHEPWFFTTESDAGAFGIEVITSDDAENGGFVNVCSFVTSLLELAETYSKVRGMTVTVNERGGVETLAQRAASAKESLGRSRFWEWHRMVFHSNTVKGVWNLASLENDRFPGFEATSLAKFLDNHSEV